MDAQEARNSGLLTEKEAEAMDGVCGGGAAHDGALLDVFIALVKARRSLRLAKAALRTSAEVDDVIMSLRDRSYAAWKAAHEIEGL